MNEKDILKNLTLTRRDFLKGLAAAGLLGSLGPRWGSIGQGTTPKWDREADVVVVGTGFAGLAAAIAAKDAGSDVLILEKMPVAGGNSVIAGGVYNCADPDRQIPMDIEDSTELHYTQTLAGGDFRGDPEKVRFMVENGLDGFHWLEEMGVTFPDWVMQIYGALYPRSHLPVGPEMYGTGIIKALLAQAESRGIPVLLEHKVSRIIREKTLEGRVLWVEVEAGGEMLSFKTKKALVLASGGFAANVEMRMLHDRRLDASLGTTNHPGATGECLMMAQNIGANVTGMDYIQCVLGAYVEEIKGMLLGAFAGLDMVTAIFVNREGKRFINEDARRDEITEGAFKQPDKMWFTLEDSGEGGVPDPAEVEVLAGWKAGNILRADTLEELAVLCEMPADALVETTKTYNSYVDTKVDPDFGKAKWNLKRRIETPPFYASMVTPSVHHTMGGLVVKGTTGQVVDCWGEVIPGFYAAGEVTGGTHGTNRLGGNATLDCIVFGIACGEKAAAETSVS